MNEIILTRHGQSEWNKAGLFTGWEDVKLSELGIEEASQSGQKLKSLGYNFTLGYTSMLRRAIQTLWLMLIETDQVNLPIIKDWHLNERHYGALQGLNKEETREKHGKEQVHIWRRSFDTRPPQIDGKIEVPALYKNLEMMPKGESLSDTVKRVVPYWESEIFPSLKRGEKIIISAHGNSLRALIMHLENIPEKEITSLEIPTGKPISIIFDDNFKFKERKYL